MIENSQNDIPPRMAVFLITLGAGAGLSYHVYSGIIGLASHGEMQGAAVVLTVLVLVWIHAAFVCYLVPTSPALAFNDISSYLLRALLPIALPSALSLLMHFSAGLLTSVTLFTGTTNLFVTIAVPLALRLAGRRTSRSS